ncbi:hypothetical protein GCM10025867_23740 [Frondihabitans sucicola]|uniref:SnoaL-like domain-containing protein n=1 Tax=Frondihabitans sucicola TaxID=1268041 RepID=A0ABM8GPE9_9MICO|nr:nuclear transport factor 2 family protein [Frondihabitans sucicola]BDZ50133.1 hypothetical protein GCM10025867_23740 [Frondihabitans sucicola]
MPTPTPAAILSFIDTTNAEDTDGFLASFTADASIDDGGRTFHGVEGIADWNESDNIGKHSRFDVVEIAEGTSADEFVVTMDVTGDGYNGIGTMTFVVDGDLVRSLVIT